MAVFSSPSIFFVLPCIEKRDSNEGGVEEGKRGLSVAWDLDRLFELQFSLGLVVSTW